MSSAAQGQLTTIAFIALFVVLGVFRRMRPQQVRPQRVAITGVVIVVVIALSLVGTGGRIIEDPIALALIPVFTAIGIVTGYYLVRTMTFWNDPNTGALWMRGGVVFAVILVASLLLRYGVRLAVFGNLYGATPGNLSGAHGLVYDLSADFLFISLGLWASRAFFIVQRYRQDQATSASPVR